MKLLFKILFSLLIFVISFILVAKIVVICDIQPPLGVLLFFCTISLPCFCYNLLTAMFEYIEILERRFKLHIEHIVQQYPEIVYSISSNSSVLLPRLEIISKNFYRYSCKGRTIRFSKEDAEKYFMDPMKPTKNELILFELCNYKSHMETFSKIHDYEKFFDELFGYYMQEGFINKIKYIIKNKDRLIIGRIG